MAGVFQDTFIIETIDKEGKKFDRVSRPASAITFMLATSLSPHGADDDAAKSWRPDRESDGIDKDFEYVMYGKVYKFDEGKNEQVTAYASFGGLLMALTGSYRHMQGIVLGENIYLLIRR
ncbi:RNA polymerase I [Auriculariales sp. MPI-PUGE-AT-0066]|nr:RNA polymerase I [Auriculariales sp. MPI-PUGE-AT-0066]